MTINEFTTIQNKIKKGCFYKIEYKSIKELKGNTIEKHTNGVFKMGINYKNLKVNKDKETKSLPYGEWEITNFIIKHKDSFQLRLYPSQCKKHKTKSFYLLNGNPITKNELLEMGLLKEQDKKEIVCFNIKLENLKSIQFKD